VLINGLYFEDLRARFFDMLFFLVLAQSLKARGARFRFAISVFSEFLGRCFGLAENKTLSSGMMISILSIYYYQAVYHRLE
jgi:hypothetical protein